MAEIIRTENLQYAYPAEEGEAPFYALRGVDTVYQALSVLF